MNKKIFGFGFALVILLILSGVASAYIDYGAVNTREDVRIYTYEPRQESVQVLYKQPKERVFFYQVGTYADVYGKFDVPVVKAKYEPREYLEQVVYQRQVDYGGYRTRQACMGSKDIVSCDGSYHVKMYWFDW